MAELLGAASVFSADEFFLLLSRFLVNFVFVFVLVRGIYYPIYSRRDYVFTYFMFNVVTFLVCFLLRRVPIELGFALGLFAVFGILRYRTEAIAIRDLTYLFISIGIALINALTGQTISVAELFFVNILVVGTPFVLERAFMAGEGGEKRLRYDRIDLLKPGNEEELLEDLRDRTGLDIKRVRILRMDLLRDTASLVVFYGPRSDGGSGVVEKG